MTDDGPNYLGDLPPALNEGEVVVDVLLLLHLAGQHPLRPQQGHQDVLRVTSQLILVMKRKIGNDDGKQNENVVRSKGSQLLVIFVMGGGYRGEEA